ncbi:hypothetical protein JZU68_10510, partial [bacterium]|nr:hypothetical protein [bacterium]
TMLPYLVNGDWYCDECLEASVITREYKWKVGDELIVVANNCGGFDKGTKVTVIKIDEFDDDLTYRVGDASNTFWHRETDLEVSTEPHVKYVPLSNQVT